MIEAVSVEAVGGGAKFARAGACRHRQAPLPARARARASFPTARWHEARSSPRDQLKPGHKVAGPAIVIEPHQTIVVEDGWQAEIDAKNHLVLDARRRAQAHSARSAPRPIR